MVRSFCLTSGRKTGSIIINANQTGKRTVLGGLSVDLRCYFVSNLQRFQQDDASVWKETVGGGAKAEKNIALRVKLNE